MSLAKSNVTLEKARKKRRTFKRLSKEWRGYSQSIPAVTVSAYRSVDLADGRLQLVFFDSPIHVS